MFGGAPRTDPCAVHPQSIQAVASGDVKAEILIRMIRPFRLMCSPTLRGQPDHAEPERQYDP